MFNFEFFLSGMVVHRVLKISVLNFIKIKLNVLNLFNNVKLLLKNYLLNDLLFNFKINLYISDLINLKS